MTALDIALGMAALIFLAATVGLWIDRRRLLLVERELGPSLDDARSRLATSDADLAAARERVSAMTRDREHAIDALRERHEVELRAAVSAARDYEAQLERRLNEMREAFRTAIESTAGKAMQNSSKEILELAKTAFTAEQAAARAAIDAKVQPIAQTLKKTEETIGEIERERHRAYAGLAEQMRQSSELSDALRRETGNLVNALRKPQVRGRYGEVQLRRVAELAGLRDYCDFAEQATSRDADGTPKRPDLIVKLPNDRCIVVDAKTNIEAYLDAIEATDETQRERLLERFARHVADQAKALSDKRYWAEFDGAHDFVVMFIPGDQFIDAALQRAPALLERAAERGVVLASPSTLIGLLRAVHVGWREQRLAAHADEIQKLGGEMYKRAGKVLEEIMRVGKQIDAAAGAYNALVGSVDARLMPQLRKFESAAGVAEQDVLPDPPRVETTIRDMKVHAAPALPEGA